MRLLLFTTLALAAFPPITDHVGKWDVVFKRGEVLNKIEVFNSGEQQAKPLMTYLADDPGNVYLGGEQVELPKYPHALLVTTWTHGMHGKSLIIFDPEKKESALLTKITSAWGINFQQEGEGLRIFFQHETANGLPQEASAFWKP